MGRRLIIVGVVSLLGVSSLELTAGCSFGLDSAEFSGGTTQAVVDGGGGEDRTTPTIVGNADTGITGGGGDSSVDTGIATDPALVGDWRLDEGTGTTIADSSGHNHAGSLLGGVWAAGHKGSVGSGIDLDGTTNNVIVIPATASDFDRKSTTQLTITAWAVRKATANHTVLVSVSFGGAESMFGLELRTDTTFSFYDGKDHTAEVTISDVRDAWRHYAATVDGAKVHLYVDGSHISEGTADTTERIATQVLLGGSNFNDRLHGSIDQVRIYRRVLTQAEIVAEMNR